MGLWSAASKAIKWAAPAALAPLTGGASLALYDMYGQKTANKENKAQAQQQMDFQERMSNTEMQRRTNDLLAAGLNPMLAYSQGGASSAQGASAKIEPITRGTVSTALAASMQRKQLENMDEQTKLLRAQTRQTTETTNMLPGTAGEQAARTTKLDLEVENLAKQFQLLQQQYDIQAADLEYKKLTIKQLRAMQPLIQRYQELQNQAEALGMTEKEVDQKFQAELGQSSKFIQFIKGIWK